MDMVLKQEIVNAEQFWVLMQEPEYAHATYELIWGEVVPVSKPGGYHGVVTMRIGRYIGNFVDEHSLGYVTAAETGYITARRESGHDSVRGLDVGFIRAERAPDGLPDKHIDLAPDLAVEVISPGNSAEEIQDKVLELQALGTPLIWLVYLNSQTVTVHTLAEAVILRGDATLDGGEVLPGFSLTLRDLFRR